MSERGKGGRGGLKQSHCKESIWPRWRPKSSFIAFHNGRYGGSEGKSCDDVGTIRLSVLSARICPGIPPKRRRRRRRPMRFLVIGHSPKLDKWFLASLVAPVCLPSLHLLSRTFHSLPPVWDLCNYLFFPMLACSSPILSVSHPPIPSFLLCRWWWRPSHWKQAWGYQLCEDKIFWTANSPALHSQFAVIESRGVGWVLSKLRIVAKWLT